MTPTVFEYIDQRTGEPCTGRAWDVGVPGLVVHESKTTIGERAWFAAHPRSRSEVGYGYTSPEAAVAAVHRLAHLADWTADSDDLLEVVGLKRAVWDTTCDGDVAPADAPSLEAERRR